MLEPAYVSGRETSGHFHPHGVREYVPSNSGHAVCAAIKTPRGDRSFPNKFDAPSAGRWQPRHRIADYTKYCECRASRPFAGFT